MNNFVTKLTEKLIFIRGCIRGIFIGIRITGGLAVMQATGNTSIVKKGIIDMNNAYGECLKDLCKDPEFKTFAVEMLRDKVLDLGHKALSIPKVAADADKKEKVKAVVTGVIETGFRVRQLINKRKGMNA